MQQLDAVVLQHRRSSELHRRRMASGALAIWGHVAFRRRQSVARMLWTLPNALALVCTALASCAASAQSSQPAERRSALDVVVGPAAVRGDAFQNATHISIAVALSRHLTRNVGVIGSASLVTLGGGSDECELRSDNSGACRERLPSQTHVSLTGAAIVPMRVVEMRLSAGPTLALGGASTMVGAVARGDIALGRGAFAIVLSQQLTAFRIRNPDALRLWSQSLGFRLRMR
jgi:hypothetical protein